VHILPPSFDPAWQRALWRRANQAPTHARLPLCVQGAAVGSFAPALLERLLDKGGRLHELGLIRQEDARGVRWHLTGEPTAALGRLASALDAAGLVGTWHDELLAVTDPAGGCIGAVERGAARLLGLPVHAIHLVGVVPGVGTWSQRRALNKAEDPGLWDTLMGGTVAFGEAPEAALRRELWEEAGLRTADLLALYSRGRVGVSQAADGDDGLSYRVDHIDCYVASMPAGVVPLNRDGEVIEFDLLAPPALAERLVGNRFSLAASCALLQVQGFTSP
jgi:8-oxo-dGTP pyrophosphatase MutT (NUDIX family)